MISYIQSLYLFSCSGLLSMRLLQCMKCNKKPKDLRTWLQTLYLEKGADDASKSFKEKFFKFIDYDEPMPANEEENLEGKPKRRRMASEIL